MKKWIILLIILFAQSVFATQFLIQIPVEQKLKTEKKVVITAIEKVKPIAIKDAINLDKFQVTDDLLWNTRVYLGYKLINVNEDISFKDMQRRIDKYKLAWTILAANDGYKETKEGRVINTLLAYDPDVVINFIVRKRIYDDKGKFLREEIPEIEFGHFQGSVPLQPKADIVTKKVIIKTIK